MRKTKRYSTQILNKQGEVLIHKYKLGGNSCMARTINGHDLDLALANDIRNI